VYRFSTGFLKGILMKMKNLELLCLFIIVWLNACDTGTSNKSVIARVGNAVLTQESLKKNMEDEGAVSGQESLYIEKWINRELLAMEAKKQGIHKSSEFKSELKILENEILIQKLLDKAFSEQINFSDEEVESFYKKNKELFAVPEEEAHLFHILAKTQPEANQALQEVRAGKQFNAVAAERSVDDYREKGGDMGLVKKSDLIPEITRAVFSLSDGGISTVLQSPYGFHVVKVVKRYKSGDILEFGDAKNDVLKRMRIGKERSIYRELLYQLQNKYKTYVTSRYEPIPRNTGKNQSKD
jgi:peptidyl-prolyl cis-trans isomerase C